MSEIKHTPGPWVVDPEDARFVIAPDPDGDEPWQIARAAEFAGPGEATIPNARLIAAAPDLLRELIEARAELEAYELEATGEACNNPELNAAISKATGAS